MQWTLWEAFRPGLEAIKESKKLQKTILKQQYENSYCIKDLKGLDKPMIVNTALDVPAVDLEQIDPDDLEEMVSLMEVAMLTYEGGDLLKKT
ncbi:hypothetical protein Tco_0620353 [Tanacetum coccineum]